MMWNELSTCRQVKKVVLRCNLQATKFLMSLKRNKLRVIIGIMSGHNKLKNLLNKNDLSNSPNCKGYCPRLGSLRSKILGDYYTMPKEIQQKKIPAPSPLY